jgi:glycosyltransferase involved in cell wall biosynthesis
LLLVVSWGALVNLMDSPITVLHLRATGFVGGPEKQILRHAVHVPRHGFHAVVGSFLQDGEGKALLEEAERLGVEGVPFRCRGPFDLAPAVTIAAVAVSRGIELICAHDAKSSLLGLMAARRARVPFIAWSRGWTGETRRVRFYDRVHKMLLRRAEVVVAVSHAQAVRCREAGVRPQHIRVIPNAVEVNGSAAAGDLRQELGLQPDSRLVLSVGRLSPEKGLADLIAAAPAVLAEHRNAVFVLVGEGVERRRLEMQVCELGLTGRVLICGFRRNAAALMAQADLLAMPSVTEGLPNVILEAFAAELPVVATAAGGVAELVRPQTGWLVKDRARLAETLAEALRDPAEARRRARAAHDLVARDFSFERQAGAIAGLYRDVLAAHGRRRPARSRMAP